MSEPSREVVGAFNNVEALEEAAESLMSNGFDRAALSLIATEDVVREKLGSRVVRVGQVEDNVETPRIAYANSDDLAIGKGALIGGLTYVGAVAGSAAVLASGGALLPAFAAAAVAGAGGGGIGAMLASILKTETAKKIGDEIERGGLILWVRTTSQDDDDRAIATMNEFGAYDVHSNAERTPEPMS